MPVCLLAGPPQPDLRTDPPQERVKSVLLALRYPVLAYRSGPLRTPASTLTPRTSRPLGSDEGDPDIHKSLKHLHQEFKDSHINESLHLLHQQPPRHPQPQPSPSTSCKSVCWVHSLAINRGFMRGIEEGWEFRHSRPEDGVRAPQYVEICEDVSHHREIEAELQALGYGYQ